MNGLGGSFGAQIGIFDPKDVIADTANFGATDKHAPSRGSYAYDIQSLT